MSVPGDVVQAWLRRARSDLELARLALQASGVLPEDACFHAQQCAEKALKALLLQAGDDPPRTHAIDVLLDRLKVRGMHIPDSVDSAFTLTEYAVQTRYPGEWEPVTSEEAHQAIDQAARVLEWVEGRVVSG
ncbi:MAG: HEPN domain-containing protein [Roseiflexus sp.]|jgi:HEPN domain-containing protein|nr:HEPN domain-containing protein [Roseiflexus sp.]MBO9335389.1 HEPN domain-containing protein [Roseiflexus sp.]MBO9363963.1 HEPN domain-containing protein [Roseiflexus sp.]MBO9388691.1 HEPN domain-containing protein [Roseiflexus sp.]